MKIVSKPIYSIYSKNPEKSQETSKKYEKTEENTKKCKYKQGLK